MREGHWSSQNKSTESPRILGEGKTYRLPNRKLIVSPIFSLFVVCKLHKTGIGSTNIQTSVRIFGSMTQVATMPLFKHFAPGISGSQFAAIGRQVTNSRMVRMII